MNEVEDALAGDPAGTRAWLRAQAPGWNVLRYAEGAALNARTAKDSLRALAWAEVSIEAYGLFGSKNSRDSCELSSMMLRVGMAGRYGAESHALAAPEIVTKWFLERLPFSLERTAELLKVKVAQGLGALPRADILALRQIKNRLSVVKELEKIYPEAIGEDVAAFLRIRRELP